MLKKHRSLDHLLPTASSGLQDCGKVFQDLFGLMLNAARDQVAGGRIQRHLTRDENETVGLDGLGVWPNGFRRVWRGNDFPGKTAHDCLRKKLPQIFADKRG